MRTEVLPGGARARLSSREKGCRKAGMAGILREEQYEAGILFKRKVWETVKKNSTGKVCIIFICKSTTGEHESH
jgi:hypothetical protein